MVDQVAASVTVTALPSEHQLTLLSAAASRGPAVLPPGSLTAAEPDAVTVACACDDRPTDVTVRRHTTQVTDMPADPWGTDSDPDAVAELEWTLTDPRLHLLSVHYGSTPVPDVGLEAGTWRVRVAAWGTDAAAQAEADDDAAVEQHDHPGEGLEDTVERSLQRLLLDLWPTNPGQ